MGYQLLLNVSKDTTVHLKLPDLINMPAQKESMVHVLDWLVKVNAQIVPEEATAIYQGLTVRRTSVMLGKDG